MGGQKSKEASQNKTIPNSSEPAFGIDLGTTNSVIGYYNHGTVEILVNYAGKRIVPSYVSYSQESPVVGEKAQKMMQKNPKMVVYDAKRMIGLNYDHST
ncbi:hypothetical protein FO519_010418, partial [Halicephalobus sp. NKZ332]